MVERLRAGGIDDPRVLCAMRALPRELFVPAGLADAVYQDEPLDIGLGQTISAPVIVALSTAALEARADAHVLEIGTGSGYGAAVLSRCHRSVVTIERHAELAEPPPALLDQLAPGAALVCPVGHGQEGVLVRYRDGRAEELAEVVFVPLVSGLPTGR
jgi:protein-L-isoaspartate(D-aspartate) O-methyltransferase